MRNMFSRFWLCLLSVTIIVLLVGIWFANIYSEEVPISLGRVSWHSYNNPSRDKDISYSVCGYGDWIYVVGSETSEKGTLIPRIEKRFKSNGTLLISWSDRDISGEFRDCVAISDKVYVVGYVETEQNTRTWIIAVFDNNNFIPLNISIRREYVYLSEAIAITILKNNLYIAGFIGISPSDMQWHIEKLSLNLSFISKYDINPSETYDMLIYFDVNPVTGDLWIAGINGLTGYWRIDVLDEDLNSKYIFEREMPGYGMPNAIAFDENGFAYIAGAGIAIFNDKAELLQVTTTFGFCPKLAYSDGIIYLFCILMTDSYNRHTLYMIDRQSFVAFTSILSRDMNANAYFTNGRLCLDEEHLYISGSIELEDSGGWIIYSIEKIPSQIPIEYVVTEPYTTTITMTISFQELIKQIKEETPAISDTTSMIQQCTTPPSEDTTQKPSPPIDIKMVLFIVILIVIVLMLISLVARRRI